MHRSFSRNEFQLTKTIDITELCLRDAHQSLLATRMALEDMVPTCADIDQAGYWSVECWGGATFDACIRFLNEDPWERLRTFRALLPNSRLQMLLRGQNLLGYRHYEDGVVDRFVDKAVHHAVFVMAVAEQVLTAQQHLQARVGQQGAEGAQPFPRVLIQKTDAGVKGGATPAFHRPVTRLVDVGAGRHHVFKRHAGGQQALVRIAQAQLGDVNGFGQLKLIS